jgi:hypothetical protein
MDHMDRMELETPRTCKSNMPAPCCRVEPFQSKTDLAISTQPSLIPYRISLVQMITDNSAIMHRQNNLATIKSALDAGPLLKIPIVPIYLRTLSILC